MASTDSPPAKKRGSRWLLTVSLALNLLIIGAVAGFFLSGPKRGASNPRMDSAISFLFREMPEKFRAEIRDDIRRNRDQLRSSRQAIENLRARLIDVLAADDFDMARVDEIMTEYATITRQLHTGASRILLEAIAEMSPEERAIYAENLKNPKRRGTRR